MNFFRSIYSRIELGNEKKDETEKISHFCPFNT